jgi:hypothetical protein
LPGFYTVHVSSSPLIFKKVKNLELVKNILSEISTFASGVFGMPARSCKDFINQ